MDGRVDAATAATLFNCVVALKLQMSEIAETKCQSIEMK